MEILLEKNHNWVIVKLHGRIDSFNHNLVTGKVSTLVKMGKKKLALDVTDVNFVSLPFFRYIASTSQKLNSKGGVLALLGGNEQIKETLQLFNKKGHIQCMQQPSELMQENADT